MPVWEGEAMKALWKVRIVAAAFLLAASISHAGTITVTDNLTYPNMNDSTCTLSQAIAAANLANGVTPDSMGSGTTDVGFNHGGPLSPGANKLGNCAGATSGANSIVFAPALAGETLTYTTTDFSATPWNSDSGGFGHATDIYNLADNYWYGLNALPPIASTISIDGGSAGITLQIALVLPPPARPRLRFFYVSGGLTGELPAGSLSLSHLTLTGGVALGGFGQSGGAGMGGAIFNQGIVNLTAVTLTSNSAIGGWGNVGQGGGGMGDRNAGVEGGGMGGDIAENSVTSVRFLGYANGGFAAYGGSGGAGGGGYGGGGGGFITGSDGIDGVSGSFGGGLGGLGGCSPGNTGCYGDGGGGSVGGNLPGGGFGFGAPYAGYSVGGGGIGGGGGGNGGGGGFGGGGGGNGGFGGGGGPYSSGGFGGGDGTVFPNGGAGAGMGGAIFNHRGSLSLLNVTVTGNVAAAGSRGNAGSGLGAAIFNLNGTVTIAYSTLANNAVSGSNILHDYIFANGFEAQFSTNTHSPGDGTVYSVAYGNKIEDGTKSLAALTISDSIIAGTVASNGAGNNDVVNNVVAGTHPANSGNVATLTFTGSNIIGASWNVGSSTGATATQNGALTSNADPKLGALFNYGGPTQTMRPLPGSPAINAIAPVAGNCAVNTDQRGQSRPVGSGCDMGAVELTAVELDRIFADNFDGTPAQ